jgi:hypothetical protein
VSGRGSPVWAGREKVCKHTGSTPLIAKLDRLAWNVHFVSGLIETSVDFIAADMPHANKAMIQMHAVLSEWERDQISERTQAALAAAKARDVVLGVTGPVNLRTFSGSKPRWVEHGHSCRCNDCSSKCIAFFKTNGNCALT